MATFTGTVADAAIALHAPTAAELDTWHDAIDAIAGAWNSYVPVWSSTGTAPALGNGTLTGSYVQSGKMVICRGALTWGSTTTGGTGTWIITLPVTALDMNQIGVAYLKDFNADAGRRSGNIILNTTSNFTTYPGSGGVVTATTPFTWAVSDQLIWQMTYEAQ